jgi:two-component system, NarL family, response regulator DevR
VIQVLVADPRDLVRHGVTAALRESSMIDVVAEAPTAPRALALAEEHRPAVALIATRMGDVGADWFCRMVGGLGTGPAVVVLAPHVDDDALADALLAGAVGFVLDSSEARTLAEQIHRAAKGESRLPPEATRRAFERARGRREADSRLTRLTPVQRRILELVAEGRTNREIAHVVHLSDKTVKNYVSKILATLDVTRRAEASAYLHDRDATPPREHEEHDCAAASAAQRRATLVDLALMLRHVEGDAAAETFDQLQGTVDEMRMIEGELQQRANQLARDEAALRTQLWHYRDLFMTAPAAYLVTDRTGVIAEANAPAGALFGTEPAALPGQVLADLVVPDQRREFRRHIGQLSGGDTDAWCVALANGTEPHQAEVTVRAARDDRGDVADLRWVMREPVPVPS